MRGTSSASSIASRIALTFAAGSIGWVLITDSVIRLFPMTADQLATVSTVKGVVFVLVIGALLFRLSRSQIREVELAHSLCFDAKLELVNRLGLAAEYRDDCTGSHNERIGRFSQVVAKEMGLPAHYCEMMRYAATLHDIGKIAIPDNILLKPGPLTPEERLVMEKHVQLGAKMLDGNTHPLLCMAQTIALTHHENWDGTGYPRKLTGHTIPLAGRIVAVCDVFDALTSDRPYKRAWSIEAAVEEIQRLAGTKFDPAVTEAFLAALPAIIHIRDAASEKVEAEDHLRAA